MGVRVVTEGREPAVAGGPPRVRSLSVFVVSGLALLLAAFVLQLLVYGQGGHSSLSDLPHVFLRRGVRPGALPYVDRVLEYPVGAGLLLYGASLISPTPFGVLLVTALAATGLCIGVGLALERTVGPRAWRWMLGLPVALFAFQNWDVFAIAALVAGLLAYRKGHHGAAGALLALGALVKLFPVVVIPVLLADRLARRDPRGALRLVGTAAATVAVGTAPFLILNARGWWWTARFQGGRNATWGSVWSYVYRVLGIANHGAAAAHRANVVSAVALLVGLSIVVWWVARGRASWTGAAAAAVAVFIVSNKVYSPTYDVWLVAFFVLVPLSRRLWVSFCVVDLAVYLTVFGYFHGFVARGVVGDVLPVLVVLRTIVLGWTVLAALRSPDALPVAAAHSVDGAGPEPDPSLGPLGILAAP
ncbi:MAG: glycosyltransferase 87 family protein [Acidimicrobiia bacterium]